MAKWIQLTLSVSGQQIYIRADMIESMHVIVNAVNVAYTRVDTHTDSWTVKESPDNIMEMLREASA